MIKVSAPGKLMVAGEWAVLEVGNPAIVAAVDKRVFAEIRESDNDYIEITLDDFNIKNKKAVFDGQELSIEDVDGEEKEKLKFIKGAIESALKYLGVCRPFRIRSWGEMSQIRLAGETKKIGFGSSAAAAAAAVAAVLAFNGHSISERKTRDIIYKLSAMAHYYAQGKVGSAFDVAASTYGGVFVYKRLDEKWLIKEMESGRPARDIAGSRWPGFSVEHLSIPDSFEMLVGWTKGSASTSAMIRQMNLFREKSPDEYKKCFDNIAGLVNELIKEWKKGNKERILELLRKNEDLLRELGQKSGVNIETPELKKLSDIANRCGGAGKLSGAGGGDCGIAVSFDKNISDAVRKEWKKAGLYLIDAKIDMEGVKVVK